jgi:hypothetical protein
MLVGFGSQSAFANADKYSDPYQTFDKKEEKTCHADALQPQFSPVACHLLCSFFPRKQP